VGALREASAPPIAPTPPLASSSSPPGAKSTKRARVDSEEEKGDPPSPAADNTARSSSSSPSSSSSSSSASSSSSFCAMEDGDESVSEDEVKGSEVPPSSAFTSPSAAAAIAASQAPQSLPTFVPARTRRETLAARANIDSRMDDVLMVEVQVNPNYPDTPTIARVQYQSNDEARRKCAVAFIGGKTGLHMQAPTVPCYLVLQGREFETAVSQLDPVQLVWHNELVAQARLCRDAVFDQTGDVDARAAACEWLWKHLVKATQLLQAADSAPVLWNQPALVVDTWDTLLRPAGTCILSDKHPASRSTDQRRSYQLRLQGANMPLTYVLACAFSSYALLRHCQPGLTKSWDELLAHDGGAAANAKGKAHAADSTDSSASDSEDGWERSAQAKKRAQQQQRRTRSLPKRMAEFATTRLTGAVGERFKAETELPLLALSAQLKIRAWEHKYMSCLVDNFQSIGCDVTDLQHDPIFMRVATSIPTLMPPAAAWCVNQYNGGADVSLFIREENKQDLLQLNACVKALFPLMHPELRLKCTVLQTNQRGRVIPRTAAHSIFLNEVVPVVRPAAPARRDPVASPASGAPPAPGSWAAVVQHGVKRLPVVNTLNHRPKKKQSGGAAAGAVPQDSSNTKPLHQQRQEHPSQQKQKQKQPQHPQAQGQQPAERPVAEKSAPLQELDARLAALEQRLNKIDTTTTLQRVMTSLEKLTARFDEHVQQVNATLSILCQHFQLSSPRSVPQPESNSGDFPSPVAVGQVPRLTLSSSRPPAGSAMTDTRSAAAPCGDSLATEHSASAHPARDNGSAARHG
jgi:hypothetical protein